MKTFFYPLVLTLLIFTVYCAQHCNDRGGCDCDCSWASSQTCGHDDGSCCYGCCCGSTPPTPPPGPTPGQETYCPTVSDLTAAYGSPQLVNQGWTIHGGGAAATKATFNLLGGSVEYDIDVSQVPTGVNSNIYTISPSGVGAGGFNQGNYCDGAKTGAQWCVEVDFIESNGNCGGQTTLHTREGPGSDGCTAWGCAHGYTYNGKTSFHMKITFGADGTWNTYRDGELISPATLNPSPQSADTSTLAKFYAAHGAVIYSSQWVGWVPQAFCGTSGNLDAATFSIRNLVIRGSVVQGPTPTRCNAELLAEKAFLSK